MGYGEYGGGGSIQNAVWLSEPDVQVTRLTDGPKAWQQLGEKENTLSRRARAFIPSIEATDKTFYGKDGPPEPGNFKVRFRFQNDSELRLVAAAFEKAVGVALEVEFTFGVVPYSPGQIKVAWGKHAAESLGDDIPDGTSGGRRARPGGLLRLWYRLLQLFR